MSGRLLRKVLKEQQQNEILEGHAIMEKQQEDLDTDESDSGGHARNPFDILNDNDDKDESDQGDESVAVDDAEEGRIGDSGRTSTFSSAVKPSNKKSKKKKKKKSKEASSSNTGSVDVDLEALSLDIDSTAPKARPGNKSANKEVNVHSTVAKQSKSSILKVDPKFLSAENELKRIFGSKVVGSFENTNQTSTSRQVRGGRRGGFMHRKCILVSPADHWPRWDGSLSMELLETKADINYFRYVHSSTYSQAQRAFEAAKAIHDLNGVASILMNYPYHVDSLMTLADYFKLSGEHQMAADAIAKCLYALECAWHPLFSPLRGDCHLEFKHETNKPLFSTLFNHMKNLDRRGCHRSALEVSKFLLSLDPADPMGALFSIDYFSLRAEEYAWLEKFSEEYQSDNSLWHLPNFAYSLAVCRFYLENESSTRVSEIEGEKETAFGLMKQALMLHPPVLKRLVAKVPLKDQAFTKIISNSLFKYEDTGIPSLDHLTRIYVERSYIIWRLPLVQKLLKDAALDILETLKHDKTEANTWACVRKEAFPSEKNEYSHLLVSDFSDAIPTMPPDNLQNFMMVDPGMGDMAENQNRGVGAPIDLANRNPLAVLFESLLPWRNFGTSEDGDDDQPNRRHQDN